MPDRTVDQVARPLLVVAATTTVISGVIARFVTQSPLWLDEALSVNIARLPLDQVASALRHDGHPPLYYWLLHGWMNVFGHSDFAVRSLSALLGVLGVAMSWLVARRIAGRTAAVATLVLVASSPYLIRYGTEARMYSLVVLLVLVGWYAVLRVFEGGSWPWSVVIAVTSAALVYTHYWSLYLMAATGSLLAVMAWRRTDQRRNVARVALPGAIGCATFVAWLGVFTDQIAHTGTPWATAARPTVIVATTINALGGHATDGEVLGVLVVVLMVVGIFGRSSGLHRVEIDLRAPGPAHLEATVLGLTMSLGIVATLVTRSAYESRYAAVVIPLALFLAGLGISHLGSRTTRSIVLALGVVLALPGIVYNIHVDRSQGGDVAARINAEAAPGDVVVFCPDQLGPAGSRSLRSDVRAVRYPDLGDPRYVDWRDYEARNAAGDPAGFARTILGLAADHDIFLVWNGGYRTFTDQCERLSSSLAIDRAPVYEILASARVFEPMTLVKFGR